MLMAAAVLLLPFLSLLYFYTFHLLKKKTSSKLPPGSFGWCPLIGRTVAFIAPHLSYSTGEFLDDNIKRYGKIFRCHLFGHPTIVSCDVGFNSFVLNNEERLFLSGYPRNIRDVLGERNLLVATGDTHHHIRSTVLGLFAAAKSKDHAKYLSDIDDTVLQLISSWKNKRTLLFCAEAKKFTFAVIARKVLSLGFEDEETSAMLENYKTFMKGLVSVPVKLPGTPYSKAIEAKRSLEEITRRLLRKRRSEMAVAGGGGSTVDFMSLLLERSDFTDEDTIALVIDLLLGGYETTAMLLSIVIKLLGDHPKVLEVLREEHQEVAAAMSGQGLDLEAYNNMEFTQCVINEALRLGNVVKFVHRKSITNIKYKGYEIPAGWKILPIFSAVHLDPSLHDHPLQFDPWRWQIKGNGGGINSGFMPFGGGKRLCSGSDLARMEAAFFIHHFILRFSWKSLKEDDVPLCLPYIDFKNGLQISIRHLADDEEEEEEEEEEKEQ